VSGRPRRRETLEIVPTGDGFVVYDPERDRVHYLNHTAALVLEFAAGELTETEIAELLQLAYDLPDPPNHAVLSCLALLRQEGLVNDG
jgi:hypothetical protein